MINLHRHCPKCGNSYNGFLSSSYPLCMICAAEAIEEGKPGDYKKARGVLAGIDDEPAEVSIRRLRDDDASNK